MKNLELRVNRIIPFSNLDGPGNRFAVFLQKCNLKCVYCHNPETINECVLCGECLEVCPVKAISISGGTIHYDKTKCVKCDACLYACPNLSTPKSENIKVNAILEKIIRKRDFLSGVSFSGGECSLQHEAITVLFTELKKYAPELTRIIDTNALIDFTSLKEFTSNSDFFIVDVKAYDEEQHIRLTGSSNKTVLKNIKFLLDVGKLLEVRTVICPDLFDCEETVTKVSALLKGSSVAYKLSPFRPHGVRKEFARIRPPSVEFMNKLEAIKRSIL